MDKNDRKIKVGKTQLESGTLERFADLETLLTITFMRKALGNQNHKAAKTKIFSPQKFTVQDLVKLATAIGCDPQLLWEMALKDYLSQLKSEPPEKEQ